MTSPSISNHQVIRPQICPRPPHLSVPANESAPTPSDSFKMSIDEMPIRPQICPRPSNLSVPANESASVSARKTDAIRPEIQARFDEIKDLQIAGIRHTTRSVPRREFHSPEAPQPFSAGRFQVDFQKPGGDKIGMILQTEAGPGHLARVVPGETPIEGGFISFLSDSSDSFGAQTVLNPAESRQLVENLYDRFNNKMTSEQAQNSNSAINYAMAIVFNEGNQANDVSSLHSTLSEKVLSSQPKAVADAADEWNIR